MDSGVGRTTALTDTMIVVSLDPVAKTVSMASIPRDMVDVPLPDGRKYRGKINGLVSYARWHPNKFPGSKDGQSVLTAALGTLLGMKIDYWAQVNLGGFVHLVDSVGGVNINVTDGFCDPRYKEYGFKGFNITPGRYHMDGEEALAYARDPQGARRERLHAGRSPAGGDRRAPRPARPRRVPGQPVPLPAVARTDDHDQHQAVAHRRLHRGRDPGQAGRRVPGRVRPPAGEVGLRRPGLDPDPRRQGDPARRPPSCSRRPARGRARRASIRCRSRAAARCAARRGRRPAGSRRRTTSPIRSRRRRPRRSRPRSRRPSPPRRRSRPPRRRPSRRRPRATSRPRSPDARPGSRQTSR